MRVVNGIKVDSVRAWVCDRKGITWSDGTNWLLLHLRTRKANWRAQGDDYFSRWCEKWGVSNPERNRMKAVAASGMPLNEAERSCGSWQRGEPDGSTK